MNAYQLILKTNNQACQIIIGAWLTHLRALVGQSKAIFITDSNLYHHYKAFLSQQQTIVLEPGEESKNLQIITEIHRQLIDMEADRTTLLVGFGGGVITDIAGFVASTYMRGIRFGFVSTSLLGQVDAVIGGKNGVNLDGYKNMIGTFNQPDFVINDPSFFQTLPAEEFTNGLAEVVKQFLIADEEGLHWFSQNLAGILKLDPKLLSSLIYRQNLIKSEIVEEDEKETGRRKILNFGHSLGHAVEKELKWKHGHAVAVGMHFALRLSEMEANLPPEELMEARRLIKDCGLPIDLPKPIGFFLDSMRKDKKKSQDAIDFILLESIGKAVIRRFNFQKLCKLFAKINT